MDLVTEHSYRSLIKPGDRFYVIAWGRLRGYAIVLLQPEAEARLTKRIAQAHDKTAREQGGSSA